MAAAPGSSGLHEVLSQVAEELRCECGPRTQSTVKERQPCQTKQLILAFFADEPAAETAALALKDSGVAESDAIGILVLDATGSVVVDKVGATSVAAGAGVGHRGMRTAGDCSWHITTCDPAGRFQRRPEMRAALLLEHQ